MSAPQRYSRLPDPSRSRISYRRVSHCRPPLPAHRDAGLANGSDTPYIYDVLDGHPILSDPTAAIARCGTKGRRWTIMGWVSKSARWQETKLRILGLALVGSLALIVPIVAHSASPGWNTGQAMTGPAPGVVQVGDGGHGSNWHPTPGAGTSGWRAPDSGPSRFNSGPYGERGVPNYYIFVPGSAIFDDPFPDWRGPTGGWGNP
jgi:hypothetical protein